METNNTIPKKRDYVGSVRIKPIAQEAFKAIAGGMIAVSSGILFFWIQSGKEPDSSTLLMLCAHALAIPLLAISKILYAIYDGYETVSIKTNTHLEFLVSLGFVAASTGYILAIYRYSHALAGVFLLGAILAIGRVLLLNKELESPHMKHRDSDKS